ncbi:uncharacterized protein LOC108630116 [Ceratina calcarata]|uniref:Uncharacterized protein LOC108630116 n=1 Tax=Ceratina calcarata TaxID=156304 RepID=A0AAJ7NCL2_9HYME|nr:uncharacterized protein LOC108630116 [Ceratina calcarata]
MAGKIKVAQINLHRSRAATGALANIMYKYKIDVALIQEPWTVGDRIKGMGMIGRVINKNTDERPRSCIVHTDKIKPIILPQFSDKDITTTLLENDRGTARTTKIVIVSMYMPHNERDPITTTMDSLIDWCTHQGINIIIGADANACHTLWGSTRTNERGTKLLDYMNNNGLTWLNEGTEPTFCTSNREETLDIMITTTELRPLTSKWKILKDTSLSDHRYITFEIRTRGIPTMRIIENKKSLDAEKYLGKLEERLREPPRRYGTPEEIDEYLKHVTEAIKESASEAITSKRKEFNTKAPWWSQTLETLNEKSNRLEKKARRTGNDRDKRRARRATLKLDREIRAAKKKSWRNFCSGLKKTQDIARINRILEKVDQNGLGMLKKRDGTMTNNIKETLETLITEHFPEATIATNTNENETRNDEEESTMRTPGNRQPAIHGGRPNWGLAAKIITEEKIRWAINTFLPYKAPGPDGLIPKYLKTGKHLISPHYMERDERHVHPETRQSRLLDTESVQTDKSNVVPTKNNGETNRQTHKRRSPDEQPTLTETIRIQNRALGRSSITWNNKAL